PIVRIQEVVAKILPDIPVNTIGAGLDAGVDDGTSRMPEFGAVVRGGNLELGQRVRRRVDEIAGAPQIILGHGVVVHSVKHEVVLFGPHSVGVEVAVAVGTRTFG